MKAGLVFISFILLFLHLIEYGYSMCKNDKSVGEDCVDMVICVLICGVFILSLCLPSHV